MARAFISASDQQLFSSAAAVSAYPASMFCWWYSTNDAGAHDLVAVGSSLTLQILMSTGDGHVIAAVNNGGIAYADNTDGYSTNTWNNSLATFGSSTNRKLYLNGGSAATNTTSKAFPTVDETIIAARATGYTSLEFDGNIAELAIWNVEISAAEYAVLNAGYSPLFIRPQSLVAYWPLIGRTSPEIDIVGGYNMTLTNSPTTAAHPPIIYPSGPKMSYIASAAPPEVVAAYRRRLIFAASGL